ncbi:MAG: SPFH domain-containing protein [Firmicutes bacterium]|nr:SPFH domain-containing protein [Bacillota bacterium]
MGLIKAALGSAGGVLADQWKEYFYCEALPENVLAVKGQKRVSGRSSNTKGSDNIITNGSVIAVADGQCMIIVDQGRIAELCAEPGEFTYDASTEPTIFSGNLGDSLKQTFATLGRRFTFGGEPPKDQRVYYFNTKELIGNKYGTPSPVPFRVVDNNIGLDMDISIRCFGEYSYRICDPMLFYKNVCGNVTESYTRETIDGQLKTELMTALQPAFAKISEMGIRYSALPGHTMELAQALNEVLSAKWRDLRGLEIVSFGVSSVKASEEDEAMIKELQRNATFRNPTMAAAHMVGAQAAAMQSAAKNENGAMMGFMGMGMAQQAGGMNANQLFQMGQQQQMQQQQMQQQQMQQPAPAPAADRWQCACGATATGKFCPECGAKKPEPKPAGGWTCPACGAAATGKFCPECGAKKPEAPAADGWTCPTCGAVNKGKFCAECGAKKPAGVPQYKCDKCGWEPADPTKPPKFCPECGDPFDDGDIQ